MKYIILLFNLSLISYTYANTRLDSLLVDLEFHMDNSENYDKQKQDELINISKLKNVDALSDEQLFAINNRLIKAYETYLFGIYYNISVF